jgi:hypothetical protein
MSPRPRGFIDDWTPQAATMALIDQVKTVLAEYRDQLPLTLRQIFYRLVGAYEYEKTYKRLTEAMNKARRARLIPDGRYPRRRLHQPAVALLPRRRRFLRRGALDGGRPPARSPERPGAPVW